MEPTPTTQQVSESNVKDSLRWVAQCARAVIMSGYTGPGHERLRTALKALDESYHKLDMSRID